MTRKSVFVFFIILFIAAFLRLYRITEIPPGINRDEGSVGYTAYSILKTGKDEYARAFPISFESFGDWKLPLYIYTVVPLVSILGLSELAVRAPSAIFGIASVGFTFFLVRILFKNNILAFLTMILIAISPWHLHLSRVESESNTAVFLTILGLILFLKSLKEKQWLIIPSSICFALTYFTYAGNHIFTTLFVPGLLFFYRYQLKKTRLTIIAAFLFVILSGFIFYHTLFRANITKLSGISIFGDPSVVHAKIELPRNEHNNPQSLLSRASHNRIVFAMERIGQNYVSAFSSEFLFIKGADNKAHNIANFGNMYLIEAPFLFLGLIYLIAFKKGTEKKLVLWWFFIAPIAASITKDAPHTNRMFAIFPILTFVTASGIYWLIVDLINKSWKKLAVGLIIFLFILNIGIYLDRYNVHFARDEVKGWGFGYKELNDLLSKPALLSKKVIMTRPEYSQYIYLLFYSKYDPSLYQKTVVRYPPSKDGFVDVAKYGRYEFRSIDWGKDVHTPNAILIADPIEVPNSVKQSFNSFEIFLPNNQSMFTVIETR